MTLQLLINLKKLLALFLAPYLRIWLLFGSFLDQIWPLGKK